MAVSLDIVYGADLMCQKQFKWWITQIRNGSIAGELGGPPCESWSVSRHKAEEDGGPEPIRNSQHPWGKPDLANRLMEQGNVANVLMLAMLEIMVECAIVRVPGLMEHPAETTLHTRKTGKHGTPASIWKTDHMKKILAIPGTHLQLINQGEFGGYSVKPTTMLVCSQPAFQEILELRRIKRTYKKEHSLQGKELTDAGMQFKTARAKEYPAPLCALFAEALMTANTREQGQRNQQQSEELIRLCSEFRDKERELGQQVKMGKDYASNTNNTDNRITDQNYVQPQLWLPTYPVTQRTYLTAPNYIWSKTIQESERN